MAKFSSGEIVQTRGVYSRCMMDEPFAVYVMKCLRRHLSGDWGELGDEDKAENALSLKEGFRLFSAYKNERHKAIWIITEADRSATTILFPEEY